MRSKKILCGGERVPLWKRGDHDVLPGDYDARRVGVSLGLADQRRLRRRERVSQDAQVRAAGGARVRARVQRKSVALAVGGHAAAGAISSKAEDWPRPRPCTTPHGPSAHRCGPSRNSTDQLWNGTDTGTTFISSSAGKFAASGMACIWCIRRGTRKRRPKNPLICRSANVKYGRPILDRGIRYACTSLDEAAKYAMISLDSTMRSNVTVGPPIDLAVYAADDFRIARCRRFTADDPELSTIHVQLGAGSPPGDEGIAGRAIRERGPGWHGATNKNCVTTWFVVLF